MDPLYALAANWISVRPESEENITEAQLEPHKAYAAALAERLGRDKNSWTDLAATLPLLSDPQYYESLRYGYARGLEPVRYVEKVREYRALLDAQGL